MTPFILVLSSPSGGGKTTIAKALLAARDNLGFSISATTRSPRPGERDGVDYDFLSVEEFERKRARGEFLEWAEYSGNLYGTVEAEVDRVLGDGRHVVLDIEVQGARQVRKRRRDVVSIFILPPSAEALVERLKGRDGPADQARLRARLARAIDELDEAPVYDYIVINDDRMEAVAEVAAIIDSESRRSVRIATLHDDLDGLRRELNEIVSGMKQ